MRDLIFDLFNNREISIGLWAMLFSFLVLIKSKTRDPLFRAVKILLGPRLSIPIILMGVYTALTVFILYRFGLWNKSLLKDTIFWFLFSGVILALNTASDKKDKNIPISIIRDNIEAIIILEFITNIYTFNLVLEIILFPIIITIILFEVVTDFDRKYSLIGKFVKNLKAVFGWTILIYSGYMITTHLNDFAKIDTLRSFVLAPILAVLFIPATYALFLYASYQDIFIRIGFNRESDREIIGYAKKKILLHCNFNYKKIRFIAKNPIHLHGLNTKKDVDNLILGLG